MAVYRGEHQSRLVLLVQGGAGILVAQGHEELAYLQVSQGSREMEVCVGFAIFAAVVADVGVVEETGVVLEDARDEESRVASVGADGTPQA